MISIVWTGVDFGHIVNPKEDHVVPFLVSQEKDSWVILLNGGDSLRTKGDLPLGEPDKVDESIRWLYNRRNAPACVF